MTRTCCCVEAIAALILGLLQAPTRRRARGGPRRRLSDHQLGAAPGRNPLGVIYRAGLLGALLLGGQAAFADEDFRVIHAETRERDGSYFLFAEIDYRFSEQAREALENGVPLTVEVHIQVREAGSWLWQDSLADQRLRYRIRYKPLSERYLVSRLPGEDGRTFVTEQAAIAALGALDGVYLVSAKRLDPALNYEVHLRASLDIEELPLPLRPMAYLRSSWKHSTGWTRWPLEP